MKTTLIALAAGAAITLGSFGASATPAGEPELQFGSGGATQLAKHGANPRVSRGYCIRLRHRAFVLGDIWARRLLESGHCGRVRAPQSNRCRRLYAQARSGNVWARRAWIHSCRPASRGR